MSKKQSGSRAARRRATLLRLVLLEVGVYPLARPDPATAQAELAQAGAGLPPEEARALARAARLLAAHPEPDFFGKALEIQGGEVVAVD